MQADALLTELPGKPIKQETWVQFLGGEDSPEKEMATHSSILAWEEFHGQKSLAGYSPRGHQRVRHDLVTKQQTSIHSQAQKTLPENLSTYLE